MPAQPTHENIAPIHVFNFDLEFREASLSPRGGSRNISLCKGSFSECTGLEATMEPKVIREGGRNYGEIQRAGRVSFGTVIFKRGITSARDLWKWFSLVGGGAYAYRLDAWVSIRGPEPHGGGAPVIAWRWRLDRCLPVKFKAPDLNAQAGEVGIEELHVAHEGLYLEDAAS